MAEQVTSCLGESYIGCRLSVIGTQQLAITQEK